MSLELGLILVPLLIATNAFFVAAEYAVVAVRQVQLEAMRARGWRRSAAAMEALKSRPADAIGAIQVCITMTNLLLGWIGEPAMSEALHRLMGPFSRSIPASIFTPISVGLSFLVVTLLTVVFGELLPKALTLRGVDRVTILTAVPMIAIGRSVRPLVWLMTGLANLFMRPLGLGRVQEMEGETVTPRDLMHLTSQAAAAGQLGARERDVILNTLALGRRKVRQIMIPRKRVAYLDVRWPLGKNREVVDAHLYSRLPVCDGGMDHVIGVVRTKDFLTACADATESSVLHLIALEAAFIPELLGVDKLLTAFGEHGAQMLFVVDEHGGVEGIVTLRDVVDELLLGLPTPPETV